MGEIPIFISKAHVFVIDPHTKKSWLPASKSAASVNFFFDSSRNSYRIISVEGSKAIINSTITPDMVLTKTSGKFGQWADLQTNTIYGLGFASDAQLASFAEEFDILKGKAGELAASTHNLSTNNGLEQKESVGTEVEQEKTSLNVEDIDLGRVFSGDNLLNRESALQQMNLLNEKLKASLAQSSANVSRMETEISSLKETNLELTSAMQDAMADGKRWHAELLACEEKNIKLARKMNELEGCVSRSGELTEMVEDLRREKDALEKKHKDKSQECSMLQQRVGVLSVVEKQHNVCAASLKVSREESQQLHEEVAGLKSKLNDMTKQNKRDQKNVHECCSQIVKHLTSVTELTQKLQLTF